MGLVIRVILQRKARYDKTVICECNSKDMYNKHIGGKQHQKNTTKLTKSKTDANVDTTIAKTPQ